MGVWRVLEGRIGSSKLNYGSLKQTGTRTLCQFVMGTSFGSLGLSY